MRLPRRVPWVHTGELEQVCSWIYADEGDFDAKTHAINRLSSWKAVTPLPHALDSTLAILTARMLDTYSGDPSSTKTALGLRQAYATAIIRMVNGLVDPLQSGAYARSIAAIATQLGLPSWLVELRHTATHEDLPSLELLREACNESLSWLLHNYFHPTLNPSAPTATPSLSLRPLAPLLKSYKALMKAVTRDGSLRRRYQDEIDAVMRHIERWITEAKVSVELAINPPGWGSNDNSASVQVDSKEKWALEIFCSALVERGGIVPVSKRKCHAPPESFLPTATSLALWKPLFMQLHAAHPPFPSIFISRIISALLDDLMGSNVDTNVIELDAASLHRDTIHKEYLARWVNWAVQTWTNESGIDLRREILLQVAPIFIPGQDSRLETKVLNELLQAISVGFEDLEECIELFRSNILSVPIQPWQECDLVDMEKRLQSVVAKELQTLEPYETGTAVMNGVTRPTVSATGWRLLDGHSKWAPCPIGVYHEP